MQLIRVTTFVIVTMAAFLAAGSFAQTPATVMYRVDGQPATASAPYRGPTTHKLTVAPASQPSPALKYRLFPADFDLVRGNAAAEYLKLYISSDAKIDDQVTELLAKPFDQLPLDQAKRLLESYGTAIKAAGVAGRMRDCDWQLHPEEGYAALVPDLSRYRRLARALALQVRVDAAQKDFDKATTHLQTGYAMARNMGRGAPLLISSLVGIAIADLMTKEAENLAQAGGPNLFWAIAWLPSPLVGIRDAMDLEANILYLQYPQLRNMGSANLTPEQLRAMSEELVGAIMTGVSGGFPPDREHRPPGIGLAVTAMLMKAYPEGKAYLAGKGLSQKEIEAMPVITVSAMGQLDAYEQIRDNIFKWFAMPYWQGAEGHEQAVKQLLEAKAGGKGMPFINLLPTLGRAWQMQVRSQRRLAALQVIEAVRAYAAEHGGNPPASLEITVPTLTIDGIVNLDDHTGVYPSITQTPPPIDPITGKPFVYTVTGQTFRIDATAGVPPTDGDVYEVTLTK